jgi:hypothetical protein
VNHFVGKTHAPRDLFGCAEGVFRDEGEAVHVRAIEGRHVNGRNDVGGEDAAERRVEGDLLDASRSKIDGRAEPALGLVAVEDLKELLLAWRAVPRRGSGRP